MTDQKYVTTSVVADYFLVNVATVRRWVLEGTIPNDTYIILGGTYRFKLPELEEFFVADTKKRGTLETEH